MTMQNTNDLVAEAQAIKELKQIYRSGRIDIVLTILPDLLECYPNSADLWNFVGAVSFETDQLDTTEVAFKKVLELKPDSDIAWFNLANLMVSRGCFDAAIQYFGESLKINPNSANTFNNLGNVLKDAGHLQEAILSFNKAIKIKPDHFDAHFNHAVVLQCLGDFNASYLSYIEANKIREDEPKLKHHIGVVLQEQSRHQEALGWYNQAVELGWNDSATLHNISDAHNEQGAYDLALSYAEQALLLNPKNTNSVNLALNLTLKTCDWISSRIQLDFDTVIKNLDSGVNPFPSISFEDNAHHQFLRSQSYSKKLEQLDVLDIEEFVAPVRSSGKLRLGYFSSDFRDHPVLHLLMGMLREHDRSSFELYGYSSGRVGECAMREEAKGYFDVFTDINEMSDADVVKLARGHRLDVVVNLNGYTGRPRNEIFAHRVAPVQINYLGFPSTMGADFMDYIVADKVIIPEEYQQYYSEKVLYLPDVYLPNDDKREVANTNTSRSDFGLPEDGFVFCCFNTSYKISPAEFDVWMRILGQVEGSVLWLSSSNKWAVENLKKEAEKRGISADRIIFASRLDKNSEHLARHKHADLFIDTFNYNAHTTAGDALMTGLPLVTKQGEQFAARVASSLLHALDLDELVTRSVEEYEALILELATKPEKLKAIKAKLAKSLTSKPVFDTKTYTQNFEQIIKNAG